VAVKVRTPDDGVTWKIRPAEALKPAARYGLKWKVAAGDAHPKTGTVTFRTANPNAAESESAPATKSGAHTGTNGATHPPANSGSHAGMSGHTTTARLWMRLGPWRAGSPSPGSWSPWGL
jgi:hypothetical protein